MSDSGSFIAMHTLSLPSICGFSGYHTVMADSGIFAPRELKAAPRAPEVTITDALAARDRTLSMLVARMAKKEEAALSELFDMTAKRLHSFSLRIVRDEGLAEEVTEDTLFQAWREATRFDAARGKVIGQFETGSAVHAALLLLPAKERQIVSLAFFKGLTHQEIADHWQMPLGSVKTLMHRAFAQLRVQLQAMEVLP